VSTRAHTRQLSIELLRIAAICGIAIFHTFQPWFEARMSSGGAPVEMPFAALG
jgi:peptidoglycan/LPS O-acetylase OafA/YrhL